MSIGNIGRIMSDENSKDSMYTNLRFWFARKHGTGDGMSMKNPCSIDQAIADARPENGDEIFIIFEE